MSLRDASVKIGQKRINLDKMAEDSQRFNVCSANVFKFNDFQIHQNSKFSGQLLDTNLQSEIDKNS
jgi:hypothetical protein